MSQETKKLLFVGGVCVVMFVLGMGVTLWVNSVYSAAFDEEVLESTKLPDTHYELSPDFTFKPGYFTEVVDQRGFSYMVYTGPGQICNISEYAPPPKNVEDNPENEMKSNE